MTEIIPALTLTQCGNIGTLSTWSRLWLGLGQEAFKKISKNKNPVCNLDAI